MLRKIGYFPDPQAPSLAPAHAERVRVAETKRDRHRETHRREAPVEPGEVQLLFGLEDLAGDRPAVLGIDVYLAVLYRFVQDRRIAQSRPVPAARPPPEALPQNIGLGETLGAHLQAIGPVHAAPRTDQQQRG